MVVKYSTATKYRWTIRSSLRLASRPFLSSCSNHSNAWYCGVWFISSKRRTVPLPGSVELTMSMRREVCVSKERLGLALGATDGAKMITVNVASCLVKTTETDTPTTKRVSIPNRAYTRILDCLERRLLANPTLLYSYCSAKMDASRASLASTIGLAIVTHGIGSF